MTQTRDLLMRCAEGDQAALAELVAQDATWIHEHVRKRLGPMLRRRHDTQDLVQNVLVEVLTSGPRFVCSDRGQMRALLARMVENVMRVKVRFERAGKRDVRRELPVFAPSDSKTVLMLDAVPGSGTVPPVAAERSEDRNWVRLALELLPPEDRNVVLWREYEGIGFAEVAERFGIGEGAARMRFNRALRKLAVKLRELHAVGLDLALRNADA